MAETRVGVAGNQGGGFFRVVTALLDPAGPVFHPTGLGYIRGERATYRSRYGAVWGCSNRVDPLIGSVWGKV